MEFPIKATLVYLTWAHVASGCGLSRKRRRWRFTLDAVPVAGAVSRSTRDAAAVMIERRRVRSVQVDKAPRLRLLRPTPLGWRVWVRLHDGQIPDDYVKVADRLAHAWRVHAVRVIRSRPGRVLLLATMRDPLTVVDITPETGELLTVRPGLLESGEPWVMDFRTVPH